MKLDTDCVRAVMLTLEKELSFTMDGDVLARNRLSLDQICAFLPGFPKENVFYAIYNLHQAGHLDITIQWTGGGEVYYCAVMDITYSGHEFLNHIRDDSRWNKVKGVANSIRDYSLSAIEAIAEGATSAAITSFFSKG